MGNFIMIMTKEQIYKIQKAWRQYHADEKHKKYKRVYHVYDWHSQIYNEFGDSLGIKIVGEGFCMISNLTAELHFLYALITKRDLAKSFKGKSYEKMTRRISWYINTVEACTPKNSLSNNVIADTKRRTASYNAYIKPILEVFGGWLTYEELKDLMQPYRKTWMGHT
jgi:hypothetical protein